MIRAHEKVLQDFLNLLLIGLVTGVLVSLALTGAVFLLSGNARADEPAVFASASEAKQGSLLFKSDQGYLTAPTLKTDVSMRVTGMLARVIVKQRFHNPSHTRMEGIYVFPLPENAAVDHLNMRIGERVIEGQVKEREAAKRTYSAAKAEGRKATLLEQERPNIFTTSVANIGPSEEVTVEIEYQQTLHYDQGTFRLRFPMVIGPRYIPGTARVDGSSGMGWGQNTDEVSDAARITPPVVKPGGAPINPVTLTIDLDAGFALARLQSPYHAIKTDNLDGNRKRITLAADTTPASRDFELVWAPDTGHAPRVALFSEQREGKSYALLMVMPPLDADAQHRNDGREVVFVIDTSGSMHGTSIEQAREALLLALSRLTPQDRFNVIEFNSHTRQLFDSPVTVTPEALDRAQQFVRALVATGGTQMAPALEAALKGGEHSTKLRQVVFLTDGAVGNEDALFDLIRQQLGRTRLFTVGIGSAPNSHFMSKAAEFGHGTFTHIGDVHEVREKMGELFSKLEAPVLTDIEVKWPDGTQSAESWPAHIPDLYAGEPVVISAALDKLAGNAVVSGKRGTQAWQVSLPLAGAQTESGVNVLWARKKIESLLDSMRDGRDPGEVRAAVVETSVEHRLVSKYTSLVAVDVTPTKPADADSGLAAIPVNLPDGWSHEHVFGSLPRTATPAGLHLLVGSMLLAVAAVVWGVRRAPTSLAR